MTQRTFHSDIPKAIRNGATDDELNDVIQDYLGPDGDVQQWRVDNYIQLRAWAYLPIAEYNDAQVKLNSADSEIQSEGQQQLENYVANCLQVKSRFPKE